MPPDAIEHPCHGRNPSKLILRESNNISRWRATPSKYGCRIVNNWMEWPASGSPGKACARLIVDNLIKNKWPDWLRPRVFLEHAILPLFSRFHLRPYGFDFRGAEFEFRNLAKRIERRICENVRGCFHESERDEHNSIRNGVILTRVELDRAAAGCHPNHVTGLDAKLHESAARKRSDGRRLQRIEDSRAARHRTCVPVFELTPRREDKRIFVIRRFGRRLQFGCHQFAEATSTREPFIEHNIATRFVDCVRGIGHR